MRYLLVLFLAVAGLVVSARAQIGIGGVAAKTVYADTVTFLVTNEAGYAYDARLDGAPVSVGASVTVTNVDYHELLVVRTNTTTFAVTNRLVQFIVRASSRGITENGIPLWTPYPPIASATGEFAGAHLRLLAPRDYPQDMEVPVVAWVENDDGHARRVNGTVAAPGQNSFALFRGVGSGFLSTTNPPGDLNYAPAIGGRTTNKTITLETGVVWSGVSGTLSGAIDWPAGSRVAVTGPLYVAAGSTLTVGEGSVVRVSPGVTITNRGSIVIAGSVDRPVVFAPLSRGQPWGGFLMLDNPARMTGTGVIFTGSGANPSWFGQNGYPGSHRTEQALFYCTNSPLVALTDAAAIYLAGQLGHAVNGGAFSFTRFLMQRTTTGGEFTGAGFSVNDSAFIECPLDSGQYVDGDNDSLYIVSGTHGFTNTLFGFTKDDGIDCGGSGAGRLDLVNCWFESTFHEGTSLSGTGKDVYHRHNVLLNCGQPVEVGYDGPTGNVHQCLILASQTGTRFADNYDWTYNGYLRVSNSIVIYNYRDVWGMNWADWTYRSNQMSVASNTLGFADPRWPNNAVWDPTNDAPRLAEYLNQPAGGPVGVGLALRTNLVSYAVVTSRIPVRLSRFCTDPVSVECVAQAGEFTLAAHTLTFLPGETLKFAALPVAAGATANLMRVSLRHPTNAEVTSPSAAYVMPPPSTSTPTAVSLIPLDAVWRYNAGGTNLGPAWRQPAYDDSLWPTGRALLGVESAGVYAEPIRTPLALTTTAGRIVTYYFRTAFVPPANLAGYTLDPGIYLDDGAVFYLNGSETGRIRMGTGTVSYTTLASNQANEGQRETIPISVGALMPGVTNFFAVEVHQSATTSSDVAWGLSLDALPPPVPGDIRVSKMPDGWTLFADGPGARLLAAPEAAGPWDYETNAVLPAPMPLGGERRFFRWQR